MTLRVAFLSDETPYGEWFYGSIIGLMCSVGVIVLLRAANVHLLADEFGADSSMVTLVTEHGSERLLTVVFAEQKYTAHTRSGMQASDKHH